jgi:hypothetical protein
MRVVRAIPSAKRTERKNEALEATPAGTATDREKTTGRRKQSWNKLNKRKFGPSGSSQKLNTEMGNKFEQIFSLNTKQDSYLKI